MYISISHGMLQFRAMFFACHFHIPFWNCLFGLDPCCIFDILKQTMPRRMWSTVLRVLAPLSCCRRSCCVIVCHTCPSMSAQTTHIFGQQLGPTRTVDLLAVHSTFSMIVSLAHSTNWVWLVRHDLYSTARTSRKLCSDYDTMPSVHALFIQLCCRMIEIIQIERYFKSRPPLMTKSMCTKFAITVRIA